MASSSDWQPRVRAFTGEMGLDTDVESRTLDLVSELGELAKEVLKGSDYGRREFELPAGWASELGDVLFALICLANQTGVDLDQALGACLEKCRARFDAGGSVAAGS